MRPDGDISATETAHRAQRWHRTRDPQALWPGIDRAALQVAADAIGAATAARLRNERARLDVGGAVLDALGVAAMLTGMGPLLGWWIERGSLETSDEASALLATHLAHGRTRMARMQRGLQPALASLDRAGVAPVVIKGLHTASAYFPDPGTRPASDADLVVAADEIPRAEQALRDAGFTPAALVREPYKRDWIPPGDDDRIHSFERFDARDRWKIELHGGVAFDHLRGAPLPLLDGDAATVSWGALGAPARVPAPAPLVALLAIHASGELYSRRLLRLVELALVVDRETARCALDWDLVDYTLHRAAALRLVHPALALVERLAPGRVDATLLQRAARAAGPLARRVAAEFTPTAPILDDRVSIAERLMWATSIGDVLRLVARWALPYPGGNAAEAMRLYQGRLRRLITGRVSWGRPPT